MSKIYKILPRSEWDAARVAGSFAGSAVDLADGFIHFSGHDTAQRTAELYFKGQADLMLLTVEVGNLPRSLASIAGSAGPPMASRKASSCRPGLWPTTITVPPSGASSRIAASTSWASAW